MFQITLKKFNIYVMKKFSDKNNIKIDKKDEPKKDTSKVEISKEGLGNIIEQLIDRYLGVKFYGPISRFHTADTLYISGKEEFKYAVNELINKLTNDNTIKLLESMKSDVKDWQVLDKKIDMIKEQSLGITSEKIKIKKLYDLNKDDLDLKFYNIIERVNNLENAKKSYKACLSLIKEGYPLLNVSKMYLDRIEKLTG
jgi:hypothetical protein